MFLDTAARFPDRLAVDVDDRSYRYADLAERAGRVASLLAERRSTLPRLGAVLASRSIEAYQGILGTLISGAGYVPLNPKFPELRNAHMLEVSGADSLVVDAGCMDQLHAILAPITRPLVVVLPTCEDVSTLRSQYPTHSFFGAVEVAQAPVLREPIAVDVGSIAYLLFTSGSTGLPKGVMVTHANVLHHLAVMWERYDIRETDRFSHTFELTFDLSVFDLFVCWGRGASLHCVPAVQALIPDEFIVTKKVTIWFSVPSVAVSLLRRNKLRPGAFPSIRYALFCGERLPAEVAAAWQTAAPSSTVENLYGPTEVTIACTLYRWDPQSSPAKCVSGVVPIGRPYPGMAAVVVDEQLQPVSTGDKGELCMRGPQVTAGYWRDPDKTSAAFVAMPWWSGPDNRWYRTGDVAFVDADGDLVHCGRNDGQIKLRGYRIELAEVEHVIRTASGSSLAAVLPFPFDDNGPTGLTAVVAGVKGDEETILTLAETKLPKYMVPSSVVFLEEMPLNDNGKIDRKRLLQLLSDAASE
jgi:amino acid adenylation domain-containing protein